MITIRCSSLPLLARCAMAGESPEVSVRDWGEMAGTGTGAHELLATLPSTDAVDWDRVPGVCARLGVDESDVRPLVAAGVHLWRDELRQYHLGGESEVPLDHATESVRVTGHADLLSTVATDDERIVYVSDWKSGRLDSDYRPQLIGYAALALLRDPWATQAVAGIVWLRDGEIERYRMRRDALPAWLDEVERIARREGGYRTGDHCRHCPRAHECPGRLAMVRADAATLLDLDPEEMARGLATMAPDRVFALYHQAGAVADVAKRVREALRLHVSIEGDVIGESGRLTLTAETRRSLDTARAWPVLESALPTDAAMAACVEVRLSRVEEAVATAAGKGKGAAAKRELTAALEAAGAIKTTTIEKLVTRRA
jgi:hypothetical protein